MKKEVKKLKHPTLFQGGRYKASVRQGVYRLVRDRAGARTVQSHLQTSASLFGIAALCRVPSRRTIGRMHEEGGARALQNGVQALQEAKAEYSEGERQQQFAVGGERDGTSQNGWHFQGNSGHARTNQGVWVDDVTACVVTHNKASETQAQHTATMKSAVEALSLENQKTHVLPLLHATNWKGVSHAGSTSTKSIVETASGHTVKAPKGN